jgi:hypothetical protein
MIHRILSFGNHLYCFWKAANTSMIGHDFGELIKALLSHGLNRARLAPPSSFVTGDGRRRSPPLKNSRAEPMGAGSLPPGGGRAPAWSEGGLAEPVGQNFPEEGRPRKG